MSARIDETVSTNDILLFRASPAQQRLWLLEQLHDGNSQDYLIAGALRLHGPLSTQALKLALNDCVDLHESLRTGFIDIDGTPWQAVEPELEIGLVEHDLRALPAAERMPTALRMAREAIERNFDLRNPPLLRVQLLRLENDDWLLSLCIHHIVCDGSSLVQLLTDIATAYTHRLDPSQPAPKPPRVQMADYAEWQCEQLDTPAMHARIAFWQQRLRDVPDLALPLDHARPAVRAARGARVELSFDANLRQRIEQAARASNVTPFAVLLGGWGMMLARWSGQRDFAIGVPITGHGEATLDGAVGFFIETAALRFQFDDAADMRTLWRNAAETWREAMAQGGVPLDRLMKNLNRPQARDRTPLFQTLFSMVPPIPLPTLPGLRSEPLSLWLGQAKSDIVLELGETGDTFGGALEYDSALFDSRTIEQLALYFATLLDAALATPHGRLADLPAFNATTNTAADVVASTQTGPFDLANGLPAIVPTARTDARIPLAWHQERIWFVDTFETGYLYDASPVYHNIPLILELSGDADVASLEAALNSVVARHEVLRTRVHSDGEQAWQVFDPELRLSVSESSANGEEALARAIEETRKPFAMNASQPLLRAALIRINAQHAVLAITAHHLIADRVSMRLLASELFELYAAKTIGRAAVLPELPVQYLDYAAWQRRLPAAAVQTLRGYWTQQLRGPLQAMELPLNRARMAIHVFAEARHEFVIGEPLVERLRTVAARSGHGAADVLFAGFNALLRRYSGHEELVVGFSAPCRERAAIAALIGPIANLLVSRSQVDATTTLQALLDQVQRNTSQALEHRDMQFDQLVLALAPDKDMSRTALFDILFQFDDEAPQVLSGGGLSATAIETNLGYGKNDLHLFVHAQDGHWAGKLVYNALFFDAWLIEQMMAHYLTLLEALATNADQLIDNVPLLGPAERDTQLLVWNDSAAAYPHERTVHQLFEEQAERTPHHIAVSYGDEQLSYRELNTRANQLAHRLRASGIERQALVVLLLERSPDMIVAILAVMKAGAAYVPIDPHAPVERIEYILKDSGARQAIVSPNLPGNLPIGDLQTITLGDTASRLAGWPDTNPDNLNSPDDLIYVIYTSGSTGQPKGSLLEHRNVVRLMHNDKLQFTFNADDVWSLFHSYAFDFSVWEMYGALLYGGRVAIVPDTVRKDPALFLDFLEQEGVTVLNQTPSAFYNLSGVAVAQAEWPLPALRYVVFGGEGLDPGKLRAFHRAYGHVALINMYGITETCVHVTFKHIGQAEIDSNLSNVGRPIPTTTVYIMDAEQRLVPAGVPGEICVGGLGVGRGYLNRADLTSRRFVTNPYLPQERIYRSGDLGKLLENGEIVHLGRMDDQVKIRGFRIELGEIEAKLSACETIAEAMVMTREDTPGDKRLVAYVILDAGAQLSLPGLRTQLGKVLPDYMIPSAFIALDAFPLTVNGKLDRKALPAPDLSQGQLSAQEYEAPLGETEQAIARIWQELLGMERVGRSDNFFEIGGHSLLAAKAMARLGKQLQHALPISALFDAPVLANLATAFTTAAAAAESTTSGRPVASIAKSASGQSALPTPARDAHAATPLSSAQARLWFVHQLDPLDTAYNQFGAVLIEGQLQIDTLTQALALLQERQHSLRTRFIDRDGVPLQQVMPAGNLALPVDDLEALDPAEQDQALLKLASDEANRPFDLTDAPLLRARLLHLAPEQHVFCLTVHHIIIDGWSLGVLWQELGELYRSLAARRPATLAPLPLQYADYAQWQLAMLDSAPLRHHIDAWRLDLADLPALDLATDHVRPAQLGRTGAQVDFALSGRAVNALDKLARAAGTTRFVASLAIFAALLGRWSGQYDFALGVPIAGRERDDVYDVIGCFINLLPIRVELTQAAGFGQLAEMVKQRYRAALERQALPFERLLEALRPGVDNGQHPLFQVLFNYMHRDIHTTVTDGLRLQPLELPGDIAQFDLSLHLDDSADGVRGRFIYRSELFDAATVERMAAGYRALLEAAGESTLGWADVELATAEDRQRLAAWNDTAVDYGPATTLDALIAEQVERTPHATAISAEDGAVDFTELLARADALAERLRAVGAGPDRVVAVYLPRGVDLPMTLLAVLRAGAAYLPLDPDLPADRLAFMVADAAPVALVAAAGSYEWLPAELPVLAPNLAGEAAAAAAAGKSAGKRTKRRTKATTQATAQADKDRSPDNLAYVIYTSGSTGKPKGVMVSHRAIANRLHWMQAEYALGTADRVLQKTPCGFDVSVWEFFWPMLTGATLVMARPDGHRDPDYLAALIEREQITTLHFVPSMLDIFLANTEPGRCAPLRRVFTSGEALSPDLRDRCLTFLPQAALHNLYGPTEAAVDVTYWPCAEHGGPVPIGRPVGNTRIHILDRHGRIAPIGVPGEICIAGVQVARGYLNRPELDAERFVSEPDATGEHARMYRTGDLGRWREEGWVEYLGRRDHQVKLRGQRIELGEIEAALRQHPAVRDAIVLLQGEGVRARLDAFALVSPGAPDGATLRAFLSEQLPAALVPARVHALESFPLTVSGKTDRRALAELTPPASPDTDIASASTATREQVTAIWCEVLGLTHIEPTKNFFEAGGNSLLLVQVHARLKRSFERVPTLTELFRYPSVAALAAHLDGASPANRSAAPRAARAADEAIAIVGMAGRFPGAANVDELWQALLEGRSGIREVSREEALADGADPAFLDHPSYVPYAAPLEGIGHFDEKLFGYSPADAALLDPQGRLLLQCAWETLEHAAVNPDHTDQRIGVFAGATVSTYALHALREHAQDPSFAQRVLFANDKDYIASRIAYKLGLNGPAIGVQTACSSSLVAVALAVQALRNGECEVALAGGASVSVPHRIGYLYDEGSIYSPDGHCRAFDRDAGGTIGGNGVAMVALKRLSAALADGDPIRAVIRGIAINNDGSDKLGFTAPSIKGQEAVVRAALADAGVEANSIGYIEAHGTGTRLGDEVELSALAAAFDSVEARTEPCLLGSLKSSIGHLDAAAGVAGLIKAALTVEHGIVPPTLHLDTPNPLLQEHAARFRAATAPTLWPGKQARRAGISSFGIGGTNAHCIVEQPPVREAAVVTPAAQLLPLSATDRDALMRLRRQLADYLQKHPDTDLAALAWTLQSGRRVLAWRQAWLVETVEGAVALLRDSALPETPAGTDAVELDTHAVSLAQAAERWQAGATLDWHALHGARLPQRLSLPAYPFAQHRHWLDAASASGPQLAVLDWQRVPAAPRARSAEPIALYGSDPALLAALAAQLEKTGAAVETLTALDGLRREQRLVVLAPDYSQVLALSHQLAVLPPQRLVLVGRHAEDSSDATDSEAAMAFAAALPLGQELPELGLRRIDLAGADDARQLAALAVECAADGPALVQLRDGQRRVPKVQTVTAAPAATAWRDEAVVLITGGYGQLGFAFAQHLAEHSRARLVLLGRTAPPDDDPRLQALRANGAEVLALSGDIAKPGVAEHAVQIAQQRFGALHAVIHAAGIAGSEAQKPLLETDLAESAAIWTAKRAGTQQLAAALDGLTLDHVLLCSSISTVLGGLGFAAYAAGNRWMEVFAEAQSRRGDTRWLALAYDGLHFGSNLPQEPALDAVTAIALAEQALTAGLSGRVLAVASDLQSRLRRWDSQTLRAPTAVDALTPAALATVYDDPLQALVAQALANTLGLTQLGPDDDFFELGGDSLVATRLIAQLREATGLKLSVGLVLRAPSVRLLAAEIAALRGGSSGTSNGGGRTETTDDHAFEEGVL
ncbi:amino acid adenylation domain-containing protein [Paraburkholderia megapolitana]|uniref:amino acid adenylation domain-containing protein n=1 Tax=Paraburkholderia megapolitana TaxID=420953 RepID=UPI0038BD1E8F